MTEHKQSTAASHLPFEDMIKARVKAWRGQYDTANRPRMAEAVTLTYRKRGDYFGYLHQAGYRSQWRGFSGTGMVTYPVISRSIRSKTATAVSTRIQTDVEPVRNTPEKQAAAEIAKNVLKFLRNQHRTKSFEAELAEINQINRFSFIYNEFQPTGGTVVDVPVSKPKAVKQGATEYACASCGFVHAPEDLGIEDVADRFEGRDIAEQLRAEYGEAPAAAASDVEAEAPQALMPAETGDEFGGAQIVNADGYEFEDDEDPNVHSCPECGEAAVYLQQRARWEQIMALTGEYAQTDTGRMATKVVSPLLLRIDAYKATGFNYRDADWFCFHPLVPAYEICRIAPHLENRIKGGEFSQWSESARWHYELSINSSSTATTGYSHQGRDYHLDELVEIEIWYISPRACYGWQSPDNYEKDGFTIKRDETLFDAWERQSPDDKFTGLAVILLGSGESAEVVAVGNEFFTEKWVGVPWKIDAQSFFPQGEENLLKLQDAATNVLSMAYSHVRRMSNPKLIADSFKFDRDDVEKNQTGQIVWTQKTTQEAAHADWRNYIGYLQPADLGAAVYQLIQFIIEIAKEESGVFNETVGNVESDTETLGGRRMALTQSLSLMTPTQQAKAVAFIDQEYVWLELVKKYAPDEFFMLIKGTFEEEWKPQDIEAFRALDISNELFISVVEGTDMPKMQQEMEQRFMVAVQLGLFTEPNQLPLPIRNHIVKSVLGIDFDIANYSAYKRLAEQRYKNLRKELDGLMPNDAFTIVPDPATGFPTRSLRPEIVASIAQDPRTAPRGTDEHLTFIEYYTDQINGLAGASAPDEVMIAVLEKEIDMHRAYLAATVTQASAVQGVADNTAGAVANAQMSMTQPAQSQPVQGAPV